MLVLLNFTIENIHIKMVAFSKFRIYHDGKMPRNVHNELKNLKYVISRSKTYIDFASDNLDNLVAIGREVYDIIQNKIRFTKYVPSYFYFIILSF